MAKDVLFEVDASQILAKLHLAGLQPLDNKNYFIVNTGIKNDDQNAKPDNPGKVTFDLKNSSGEYEVGYVTEIKYTKLFDDADEFDDIQKLLNMNANKPIDGKIDKKYEKELESVKERIYKITGLKPEDYPLSSTSDIETAKKAYDQQKKKKDTDIKGYDDVINEEWEKKASKKLETYMKVFCGKDNVGTITKDVCQPIEVSPNAKDSNDSSLVKMFQIVPISKADKQKIEAQARAAYAKDPANCKDNVVTRVCFKIKYEINVDK